MKFIKYSLICEDNAHKIFIEQFIERLSTQSRKFEFNQIFYKKLLCRNSKDVLNKLSQAADYSFLANTDFFIDLLFAGIDYDDRKRNGFGNELNKLYEKINVKAKSKVVIFFPVQAIEHWFLLLKTKKDIPSLTKNISTKIEAINRKSAKDKLYTTFDKDQFIKDLLIDADFEWLQTQSQSFRSFYNHLHDFLSATN